MLRGLVMFTDTQINELAQVVDNDKLKETSVYIKIMSAKNQKLPQIPLQLSEDEVDLILDQLEPEEHKEIRAILTTTMLSWRS